MRGRASVLYGEGAIAEDRLHLTGRWSVIGGLRFDLAELERVNLLNSAALNKTFANTSARLGIVY